MKLAKQLIESKGSVRETILGLRSNIVPVTEKLISGDFQKHWNDLSSYAKKSLAKGLTNQGIDIEDADAPGKFEKLTNRSPELKDKDYLIIIFSSSKNDSTDFYMAKAGSEVASSQYNDRKSWKDRIDSADAIFAIKISDTASNRDKQAARKAAVAGIPAKATYGADKSGYRSDISTRFFNFKKNKSKAIAGAIDTADLEDSLTKTIGQAMEFTSETTQGKSSSGAYVTLTSDNLKVSDKILGLLVKEIKVEAKIYVSTDRVGASIHLWYNHHTGGSNGIEIGKATYDNGSWTIKYNN